MLWIIVVTQLNIECIVNRFIMGGNAKFYINSLPGQMIITLALYYIQLHGDLEVNIVTKEKCPCDC